MKNENKKLENIIISSPRNSPRQRNLSCNNNEINNFITEKIIKFKNIIQKTIPYVQKYKTLEIYGPNDLNLCIASLNDIYDNLNKYLEITENIKNNDNNEAILNELQNINNELSSLFKIFGTAEFNDIVNIIFGNDFLINSITDNNKDIYDIIQKHVHPIGFKIMTWKNENKPTKKETILAKNRIIEDFMIVESSKDFDCFDLARTSKNFQTKVSGIKIVLQNNNQKKTLIICGIVDDILLNCYEHNFLINRNINLMENKPHEPEFQNNQFVRFIKSLTLKEFLVYNNEELYNKYMGYISQINLMKQKTITQIVKEFIANDLYTQRLNLIHLLLKDDNPEFQYLAYLLYDLRSTDNNGTIDSTEQSLLYDSLPWIIKQYFREAMKMTVNYTKTLTNFDESKIPFEQQICLLKVNDHVKEKAMTKLKEIKAKSEDTGSKARQYLDGLLKIPFGIYREEDILKEMKDLKFNFKQCIKKVTEAEIFNDIPLQENYNSLEISIYLNKIKNMNISEVFEKRKNKIINFYLTGRREQLKANVLYCNNSLKKFKFKRKKLCHSGKKSEYMKNELETYINDVYKSNNYENIFEYLENRMYCNKSYNLINSNLTCEFDEIEKKWININDNILKSRDILEDAVHGHESAKRQIERIIGQWVNGEQTGYCFGFEGPPGIGKCLKKDTPIMLSNGKIKMVQDITIEDKLMGDDSKPRNVLALGSGREKMYRVEQMKGDSYTVNESHILSLKMTKAGKKGDKHQTILGKRYFKNDVVDICIKDYLTLPKYLKECLKGYKVGLDFREQEVSLEPYALGYWLGDGDKTTFRITTIEKEVVDYFNEYSKKNGLQLTQGREGSKNEITYHITTGKKGGQNYSRNVFLNSLKQYNLIHNKHIPDDYKVTSRENRLSLLAGLIDSDGYYNTKNNALEIIQKNKTLANDILFLIRSLGMRGMIKECQKSCTYKGEKKTGTYHRIIITGSGLDEIPVLLERKKARTHKQIKNCLNTGIKVIPLEEDKYYGFQIDGNSRFLLGDFTVTHNTSLAKKGLSCCLKDKEGNERPFSFIAMGGSSNGSTLEGHNYTYVGSTWGKVVDILIETKCMNPIIFIDELDKISRTEHGREIIGILTHLVDPTQNATFQDKYFSGIDLDLSKTLFIFSYNDAELIDRILLDRIHRIKFENLTLEEKLVICHKFILPEILTKMGLIDCIQFTEDNLKFIINNYTLEPGVRKLKEILFEIISEINLEILAQNIKFDYPITFENDLLKTKYLKERHEVRIKEIPYEPKIGIMNGLWANAMGQGGIIPIEISFYPVQNILDLKLTGMQGDVMKESMNVAKTLAWQLTTDERKKELVEYFKETNNQGLHIHCPEGAVPKDGPSAGTAITVTLYSLFNNKKINNKLAITGEMNLQGKVTAIGGLDLKILGGIRAGVKTFLFPKENDKEFKKFWEKYKDNIIVEGIEFKQVDNINEVLKLVYI
mgnify:FL=1